MGKLPPSPQKSHGKHTTQAQNNSEKVLYTPLPGEYEDITTQEIQEILELTIKKDNANKLITFLAMLLAYTEDSQLNLVFSAPSSSGKSYLALEVASLFPEKDLIKLGTASPTAFYHSRGTYDEKRKLLVIDLERKILIFKDMPHYMLLEKLRSLLSKDEKESLGKITEKQNGKNIAKDVALRGFSTVVFASANYKLDEQEVTRSILLSPETSQEKVREAIMETLKKESNKDDYYEILNKDPRRIKLIKRIKKIKKAKINNIDIENPEVLHQEFLARNKNLTEKDMRDFKKVVSLAKGFALLNLWNRSFNKNNRSIKLNDTDIKEAFSLWDKVRTAQELGLSPYLLSFYKDYIWDYSDKGTTLLSRQDIQKNHFEKKGKQIPEWKLRQEILPMLSISGIISEEESQTDKRIKLVKAVYDPSASDVLTVSPGTKKADTEKNTNGTPNKETSLSQSEKDDIPIAEEPTI